MKLKTQKLKYQQKSKTQILIKLKISNCDKTQIPNFDHSNSEEEKNFTQSIGKNNLTPQQPMRYTLNSLLIS